MALKGVLRPGYIQIRVLEMDAAIKHYVDHIGLHEVAVRLTAAFIFGLGTSSTATA
jgi:catechol 2,3-dioxygenase